jgi:predicted nucleic acid-binding protein
MYALMSSGTYFVADLTAEVALRAQTLYAIPERGDRLIAATAAHLDLPLVTRDPEIARVAGLTRVW